MKRTFVFCANISHYNSWLRKNNLNPFEYRFLGHEDALRGFLELDIIALGGFENHPEYNKIYDIIKGLNFLGRINSLEYYEEW